MSAASEVLSSGVVLLDGAMATRLFARGLAADASSVEWNLGRPDEVIAVHEAYLAAGCEVIQSNTFLPGELSLEYVSAGAALARRAVEGHGSGFVAGNLGPFRAGTPPAEVRATTAELVRALEGGGVDWISLETLGELEVARLEVEVAVGSSTLEITACVTLSADEEDTRVLGGASLTEAARALEAAGAVALGINCSAGSAQVLRALPELLAATHLPVIAKPNAGAPRQAGERLVWDAPPHAFAADLRAMVELGARAVGGCCGTDESYLAAVRDALPGPG